MCAAIVLTSPARAAAPRQAKSVAKDKPAPADPVRTLAGAGPSELEDMLEGPVERGDYFRSDQFSFAKLGVTMFHGESGENLRVGGPAAGHAATLDPIQNRCHKSQDDDDPRWDLAWYYALGRDLANGSSWPNRYGTAEFRAVRAKSRAGR